MNQFPIFYPGIIKEAESIIGDPKAVALVKDTIISISENISSGGALQEDALASDENNLSKEVVRENVENDEALINNEKENKNSIFMNIIYAVIYGTVALVTLDYVSRLPTDPEFYSNCSDFVGGIVSIGLYSITSILQMLFGEPNNDNSKGSSGSNTSESLNNKGRSDNSNNMQTIEYKKDPQPSILDKAKTLFIGDKPQSNNNSSEPKYIFKIGSDPERGESSNSKSNDSRANNILGFGNSLKMPSLNTPYISSLPDLPSMPKLPTISNPLNGIINTGDDIISGASKSGEKALKSITKAGVAVLNGTSNTGEALLYGASNTGDTLLKGVSNTGDALLHGITNTGTSVIKGVSNTGEALLKGVSNSGEALAKGVSNTGNNIGNGISDIFNTNQSKIPVPSRLISPWGAEYRDPSIKSNEDGNSLLDSTKKFFKRQGDNTFTEIAPNTGPLPTNVRESMIPMITLNNSNQHIELEPYVEESDTEGGTEIIYIINNVTPGFQDAPESNQSIGFEGDEITPMELERTIMDHSEYINEENRKDQRSIIHNYGNQIRLLSEGLDERDEIIKTTGDVLMFQEKEIVTLIQVERQQQSTIMGQTNELDDNLLELNTQNEIIQSQIETINQQESVIKIQREAVHKSLIALNTLTNNIQYDNGQSLLTREDVKLLVESVTDTADMETTEIIKPRFEQISSRALYTIQEEVDTSPQYLGLGITSENNLLLGAPLDLDNYRPIRSTSLNDHEPLTRSTSLQHNEHPTRSTSLQQHENPPRSTSIQNDHPTRSTSLRVPTSHGDTEVQNEPLTRSTSLPHKVEEFWDRQPDNKSLVSKVKWKYGL